ncbi:VIT1/CCC1 transporter family protein [Paraburkholderia sp. BL6665CI2N2]|uniref:VIT1/CCC1 transporter family protein n=1 Tax=Paraburkholderia sp. BL6665CI2N2 TaxID=1938806 RepID=UPI001FBB0936|nr:VIT1/CCC1 transporter family protein [Paraburkholderia sp. BL6665CI2N2]
MAGCAEVLGANDRIISKASLITAVASAHAEHAHLVHTGLSGLVATAMSMARDEYVSGSLQARYRNSSARRRSGGARSGWRASILRR